MSTVGVVRLATSNSDIRIADAAAVLTVAEEHDQVPPSFLCRRGEGHGDAVEDRAAAMSGQRCERGIGRRCRCLKVRQPSNLHVERDELQPISRAEIRFELTDGLPQLVEDRARDARAHVEDDGDVDGQPLVAQIRDLLPHAVVEQLEIRDLQTRHRPLLAPDRGFDAHDVRTCSKRRCRGLILDGRHSERRRGNDGCQNSERESSCAPHCPSSRSLARIAGYTR